MYSKLSSSTSPALLLLVHPTSLCNPPAFTTPNQRFLNVQRGRRTSAPMCQNQLSSIFLSRVPSIPNSCPLRPGAPPLASLGLYRA
ncbi:uncharacterized protein CCOS01_09220 [Colletotrichum costaricense]|uniref:Uncharacterized protein n=1 Tax=Colletotrichum costaricense TaxID=1209916 RepID=A0AAI9YTW6_9PEZI|nr:uncharacterized protein CCOS01_09220 [Colletotrichum costaricense]KAK1524133.1 hypothetical protein CCOS01_09220 [Colletotrichum costaricense]